jgi:hypothetical protein
MSCNILFPHAMNYEMKLHIKLCLKFSLIQMQFLKPRIGIIANLHETSNSGNTYPFIFFYMVLIGHKCHQILVFMLDPRFKICM